MAAAKKKAAAPAEDTSGVKGQAAPADVGTKPVDPQAAAAAKAVADGGAQAPAAKGKAKSAIKFTLNDVNVAERVFTPEDHGDTWKDQAEEFATTHAAKITGREDL